MIYWFKVQFSYGVDAVDKEAARELARRAISVDAVRDGPLPEGYIDGLTLIDWLDPGFVDAEDLEEE